nr:AraC family transcriptional regulator [Cereibacter sphaeroides f. sp. denitrificans]
MRPSQAAYRRLPLPHFPLTGRRSTKIVICDLNLRRRNFVLSMSRSGHRDPA